MTLVLAAIGERWIAVASDGSVTRCPESGNTFRVADDYKKFREVDPGIVVVSTLPRLISDTRLYPQIETFLKSRRCRPSTFREICEFIAARLPLWCAEHVRLVPELPAGVKRGQITVTGIDLEENRTRLVVFEGRLGGYEAFETDHMMMGATTDGYPSFKSAVEQRTPATDWPDVMDRIIVESASRSPEISDTVFSILLEWEQSLPGRLSIRRREATSESASQSASTTGERDYAIGRDTQGGTPRRVTFTASASGFVDVTDGVDVPPDSTRFRCRVYNSASQTIANNTPTALSFDSELNDTGGLHSTSTNKSRITVPAGGDTGTWLLAATVTWAGNATGARYVEIKKNNTTTLPGSSQVQPLTNGQDTRQSAFGFDDSPAAGDYYEVIVSQTSGGNLGAGVATILDAFCALHQW